MFVSRALFEMLCSNYERHISDMRVDQDATQKSIDTFLAARAEETERGLQRILAAKEIEIKALIAVKDDQINFLRTQCQTLSGLVRHERDRAEAAIDQRLVAAEGQPVRHADLQRDLAEKEVANADKRIDKPADKNHQMADVFKQINGVLGDEGDDLGPLEKMASVGGHAA